MRKASPFICFSHVKCHVKFSLGRTCKIETVREMLVKNKIYRLSEAQTCTHLQVIPRLPYSARCRLSGLLWFSYNNGTKVRKELVQSIGLAKANLFECPGWANFI